MDKLILIIVSVVLVLIFVKMANKKKPNIINETAVEEILLTVEPKKLKVFCETCGNSEVKSGETIPILGSGCFFVKGYTLKGEEVRLNGYQLSWDSSCGCVKFAEEKGPKNCLSCSLGNLRNVWVKYSNGVTLSWKIDFGKAGKNVK